MSFGEFPATRHRVTYAIILTVVLGVALGSRNAPFQIPPFISTYAGDTLWALFVFLGIRFLIPTGSILGASITAGTVSVLVEISQLYHGSWIDAIRETWPGALILGHNFIWSDFICYFAGIGLGALFELAVRHGRSFPEVRNEPDPLTLQKGGR